MRRIERLLVTLLGLALLGTGFGLLVVKRAAVRGRAPAVDLAHSAEHYRQVVNETAQLLRSGSNYNASAASGH